MYHSTQKSVTSPDSFILLLKIKAKEYSGQICSSKQGHVVTTHLSLKTTLNIDLYNSNSDFFFRYLCKAKFCVCVIIYHLVTYKISSLYFSLLNLPLLTLKLTDCSRNLKSLIFEKLWKVWSDPVITITPRTTVTWINLLGSHIFVK